jgi:hypothetical protein
MPIRTSRKRHKLWDIPKKDVAEVDRIRVPWWGLICVMVATLPVCWLLDRARRPELTIPVMGSVYVFGVVLVVKWRLRHHLWFWLTITFFAALHVAMFCFAPWMKREFSTFASIVFAAVDVYAMLAMISVVGHLCGSEV